MTKRYRRYFILLIVAFFATIAIWFLFLSRGLSTADCQRVIAGMSYDDVITKLGRPPDIVFSMSGASRCTWEVFDGEIRVYFIDKRDVPTTCTGSNCTPENPIGLFFKRIYRILTSLY